MYLLIVLVLYIVLLCTFGVSADQYLPQKEFFFFFFNSCFLLSTSFSFFQAHKKFFLYSCRSIFLNRHSYSASPEFVAEPGALNWECLNGLPVNNHLPTPSSLTLYTIALTNAIDHYRSNAFFLPFPCFGRL